MFYIRNSKLIIFFLFSYLSLFSFLFINSFVKAQRQNTIPICVSPQHLVVWPSMTTNTVPIAKNSSGELTSSYLKYGITNIYYDFQLRERAGYFSFFGDNDIDSALYIRGGLGPDGITPNSNYNTNWSNFAKFNLMPIYITGPRRNWHSAGSLTFFDISTSTSKQYQTLITLSQFPSYKYWNPVESSTVATTTDFGKLRIFYGEFNPTNNTTIGRTGQISPRSTNYQILASLEYKSGLGSMMAIGTTNPQANLHVIGDILSSATITASRFCIGNNCLTQWPSGVNIGSGTARYLSLWTSSTTLGNSTIYQATNGNIGIGTTTPQAKLHVVGNILSSATITASRFCIGNNCLTQWPSGVNIGSGTARYLSLWTSSTTLGNSTIYQATNGNIGIGTPNPQAKLHVVGNILASSTSPYLEISRTTTNSESGIRFKSNNSTAWEIELARGDGDYLVISNPNNQPVITLDGFNRVHIGSIGNGRGRLNIYSQDGSRLLLEITEE
ncbi:MAG: hypothetical protein KatS3mg095_0110 [Candidatus Parcubacteria bacterium]|nr:MAG: hypothetical protein KatS3mg095_0110 [Candidatus Parcubacteria bacterium]